MPRILDDARAQAPALPITLSFKEKMLAGAIARGVAQTVLHPVDVVRTRLQARGILTAWRPSVFIKGVIPQISLAIPAGAVQFLAFEAAKDRLASLFPEEKFAQARVLAAGAFGALAAASFRVPQEVLKQRLQADIYPNFLVAVQKTLFEAGPASLYKGGLATISRDVPWNALSFMFHNQGKKIFKSIKGRAPRDDENLFVAGVAGAVAAVIMTPVDVVKTRIMTQQIGTNYYSGIFGTLNKIVQEEGAATLMKGLVPRILFLAPLAGITFSVYESVAARIKRRKAEKLLDNVRDAVGAEASGEVSHTHARQLRQKGIALRFSKNPVRLATSSTPVLGDTLGNYVTRSPIFFSLPA